MYVPCSPVQLNATPRLDSFDLALAKCPADCSPSPSAPIEAPLSLPVLASPVQLTATQRLDSCILALAKGPSDCMLVAGTYLSTSLSQISDFLRSVVKTKGRSGSVHNSPPILYVCGASGTSKTMGIHQCCSQVVEQEKAKHEPPPKISFLNASMLVDCSEK